MNAVKEEALTVSFGKTFHSLIVLEPFLGSKRIYNNQ